MEACRNKRKAGALDQLFHDVQGDKEAIKAGNLTAWFARQAQLALGSKHLIAMSNLNADDPKHVEALLKLQLQQQRSQRESEATSLDPVW